MSEILRNLVERLDEPALTGTAVIPWSCPVPAFGVLANSVVATLGLNPSNREFVDERGAELEGRRRRLHTLRSLGLARWGDAREEHLELIAECCAQYFRNNPYRGWFGGLEDLFADSGASYQAGTACHLDLIPYATACKWTDLSAPQRSALLTVAGDTLGLLLRHSSVRLLVLNGETVVSNLQKVSSAEFERVEMRHWTLPRRSGIGVAGYAYRGCIRHILGIELDNPVHVLGYNHNIQSSFGVTSAVKRAIRAWIAQAAKEVLDEGSGQTALAATRGDASLVSCLRRALPGIQAPKVRKAFLEQVLESIHRVDYIRVIDGRTLSGLRADPNSDLFDPIKAAILHKRAGDLDEACWLVFLSVHFGRHVVDGWRLARDVYGGLGQLRWDWPRVSASPAAFRAWLAANIQYLKAGNHRRRFGNHRKYETLDAHKSRGTGEAVETYVKWVNPPRDHAMLIDDCRKSVGTDPGGMFDDLYHSMAAVATFGRTARFDYLTMLGKLKLAPIEPNSTYMDGATGPYSGGNLLFRGSTKARLRRSDIDASLRHLGESLGVGMQVLEDALCNWQKSPSKFIPFRG